jgi:N-formylglutamate amidohydrolase
MGTVSLWGTVIEGELGYRASHAYPHRLYVPVNRAHRHRKISAAQVAYELKTTYRVDVVPADISVEGEEAAIQTAARGV